MQVIAKCLSWLRCLDDLSRRQVLIRGTNPVAAITVATAFLIAVMSFNRFAVIALLPFFLYPIVTLALSGISALVILRPLLLLEPFIICIGLLNPWLDSQPVAWAGFTFARGWLPFFSLVVKGSLAASAALLLTASLGMEGISAGLRGLGLPKSMVLQIGLTFRYIWVLLEEAGRIMTAYALRSRGGGGIRFRDWGTLAGSLLLRSYERAERVYQAMRLRGFDGECFGRRTAGMGWRDAAYIAGWLLFFTTARFVNMPLALGKWLTEIF